MENYSTSYYLTAQEALDISIIKWKFISKKDWINDDDAYQELEKTFPDIDSLDAYCGLCAKYLVSNKSDYHEKCRTCPLYQLSKISCYAVKSPYCNWEKTPTKENALIILNFLIAANTVKDMKFNINERIIVYPTESGWKKIREITKKAYDIKDEEYLQSRIDIYTTKDGGFEEQLRVFCDVYHELFMISTTYIDTTITL